MVASAQLDYYALGLSYTILLLINPFANIKYANTFTLCCSMSRYDAAYFI